MHEQPIFDIGPVTKTAVREAVRACVQVWPNSHLGAHTTLEDIQSAFRIMRRRVAQGESLVRAATHLLHDSYRYEDM